MELASVVQMELVPLVRLRYLASKSHALSLGEEALLKLRLEDLRRQLAE